MNVLSIRQFKTTVSPKTSKKYGCHKISIDDVVLSKKDELKPGMVLQCKIILSETNANTAFYFLAEDDNRDIYMTVDNVFSCPIIELDDRLCLQETDATFPMFVEKIYDYDDCPGISMKSTSDEMADTVKNRKPIWENPITDEEIKSLRHANTR